MNIKLQARDLLQPLLSPTHRILQRPISLPRIPSSPLSNQSRINTLYMVLVHISIPIRVCTMVRPSLPKLKFTKPTTGAMMEV